MRTLDSNLQNALAALARNPSIAVTCEDHILHYSPYQSNATADAWVDAAVASDGSIVRVSLTRGSAFVQSFKYQRITDPGVGTQWSTWNTFSGGSGNMFQDGGCAVSNNGGTLRAFAQQGTGGNAIWVWTSTNNGASWTGPVTVLSPPSSALTKGISSAGNNDVFFLYDVAGGEAIGYSTNSGSWSALSTWTLAPIQAGAGLAVARSGGSYYIAYSDGYTLFTITLTGSTWNAGTPIAPATSTAIQRIGPRISYDGSIYTLAVIEYDSGSLTGTSYSYPRLRQSSNLVNWSNGVILQDIAAAYSANAFYLASPQSGSSGARYYAATVNTVQSTQAFSTGNANQYVDVSGAVLSYQRTERINKPSELRLLLDNKGGAYNALVNMGTATYEPIGPNTTVKLSEGYKVGSPPTTPDRVQVGQYHINQVHFVRSPQENELLIVAYDLSRRLDLENRYQMTYTNYSISNLIAEVCARAGLLSVSLPATSQMSQNVVTFILKAGQTYRRALDELCQTYSLVYFMDQNEVMQFAERSGSDASVWTYSPEWELISFGVDDLRANHIIVSGKPPALGQAFQLTEGEAYDMPGVHLTGEERLLHYVDQKLTSTSQTALKAGFLLAEEQRRQTAHTVEVPLHPGLQLNDVITLTDSGSGQSGTARIIEVKALFDAQKAEYNLNLSLEGV